MDYKLCIGTGMGFDESTEEQIRLIKKAGFDGFFTDAESAEKMKQYASIAKEEGLFYQSAHAPFGDMHIMWEGNEEESEKVIRNLFACVDACREAGVEILICHVIIGMERNTPNEAGVARFRRVAEYAREKSIKIAFENTEGEEYLKAVMDGCRDMDNVGFCFDSGHERCYNYSRDMLALYGDRLIATHLNDNLAMKDENVKTWLDDLHLLPFDGDADWEYITSRLKKSTCPEYLTFELVKKNKPGRHEHDIYDGMSFSEYTSEAYKRAEKIRQMMQ